MLTHSEPQVRVLLVLMRLPPPQLSFPPPVPKVGTQTLQNNNNTPMVMKQCSLVEYEIKCKKCNDWLIVLMLDLDAV